MRKKALQIAKALTVATESIGAVLMLSIVIMNFFQVFFRYVVVSPLGWTEEAMRYSIVWTTFLVAGAALFRGEHMIIDVFGEIFPAKLRRIQNIVVLFCISAFCLILVVFGWPQAIRNLKQFSPSAQIPMIVPYMSVVVGGLLMLIKAICLLIGAPERIQGGMEPK